MGQRSQIDARSDQSGATAPIPICLNRADAALAAARLKVRNELPQQSKRLIHIIYRTWQIVPVNYPVMTCQ